MKATGKGVFFDLHEIIPNAGSRTAAKENRSNEQKKDSSDWRGELRLSAFGISLILRGKKAIHMFHFIGRAHR